MVDDNELEEFRQKLVWLDFPELQQYRSVLNKVWDDKEYLLAQSINEGDVIEFENGGRRYMGTVVDIINKTIKVQINDEFPCIVTASDIKQKF